jgi:flagellin
MLAIKNNIMAANAARFLGRSYDALATSVERLSSGLRINSAKDDAAGLAVRELMRSDIAVMQQGSRNALDGVSMLQTTEGAMQTIDDILTRMKQLAEQAATGLYTDAQRTLMNTEFTEIGAEITRIAGADVFNGIVLLDSDATTVTIRFGEAATDAIDVTGHDMTLTGLGLGAAAISDATVANTALGLLTTAIEEATTARASFGAKMNRLEHTVNLLSIQTENTMAAESRISDVDVATEMAAMTRNQVLAQAGTAMLAQANTMPQMALTLLR